MNVILFNGPPSSGKDTCARYLLEKLPNTKFDRMSMPIKRAFAATVDCRIDQFGNVEHWEDQKDLSDPLLNGKSYRQWQIDFSEKFMKPLFGKDIFGRLFAERNKSLADDVSVLVPDCGFEIECEAIREYLPTVTIIFIRVHREGCNFDKDSRSYLYPTSCRFVDLYNDGPVTELFKILDQLVEHGWLL